MYDAVELERPDQVFHLGDYVTDAEDLANAFGGLDMSYVPGNCDGFSAAAPSLLREVCGTRILLTHGHLFGVKTGLARLLLEGRRLDARLVLFGHTHRPLLQQQDGIWLLNPGSCSALSGSYAAITFEDGKFHCELKEIC